MGLIKRFKDWLGIVDVEIKDIDILKDKKEKQNNHSPTKDEGEATLDKSSLSGDAINKFNAEFHNPRLTCFACSEEISEGKIRYFNAGDGEKPFHKRCFKKMQKGTFQ